MTINRMFKPLARHARDGQDGMLKPAGAVGVKLATRVGALPQVRAATGVRLGAAQVDGKAVQLWAIDPATAFELIDVNPTAGSPADLVEASDRRVLSKLAAFDEALEKSKVLFGGGSPGAEAVAQHDGPLDAALREAPADES